jgi:plasmid stabilization system protein ParE
VWWRTHRPAARQLLRAELAAACELLAANPSLGRLDERRGGEIRRIVLPSVRYVLYYRVDEISREVQILAFWHASRAEPDL